MITRSSLGLVLATAALALATACMQSGPTTGRERTTEIRSSVETVTWADGKAAYADQVRRARRLHAARACRCATAPGQLQVLKSENMPTTGESATCAGRPSSIIRCG